MMGCFEYMWRLQRLSLFHISDTIDFLELMVDHMDDLPMCAEGVRGV
jgi:hypothetical protein